MSSPLSIDELDPPKSAKRQTRGNWRRLFHLSLGTVIALALNYLSCASPKRWDLSESQLYSLSPRTQQFLASPVIAQRAKPIQITVAFRRSTPFYDRMRQLIEDYPLRSSLIQVKFLDPLRNPNDARELQNKYNLTFEKNQVIVDARPDPDLSLKREASDAELRESAAHVRFLSEEDLLVKEKDEKGNEKTVALKVEDAITAAIVSATEGKERRVYLVSDKSNLGSTTGEDAPFWRLYNALRLQNIALIPILLSNTTEIPKDAEAVAFVAPQYDLEEDEIAVLNQYWLRPDAGLLFLLDPKAEPKRLHRFLRDNGVTPRRDRLMRVIGSRPIFEVTGMFTTGVPFIRDFWGKSTIFDGQSRSLEVRENDDRLELQQIRAVPLIEAAKGFYGESRFSSPNPSYDPTEDHASGLALAASVERGNPQNTNLTAEGSRMIILSNTDFLYPENLRSEQLDFITSGINWMLEREELAGIGARQTLSFKLSVDRPTRGFLNFFTLILLPSLSLIIGLIVWNVRRR